MLAWLNMGNIPPHLRAVTFKVAARGGERAKGRRPGNFSGVGGNFLLFWEGKIPRILAAVLINVRVLLHIWRLSPSIQTVDTPKVKAVTPQATGTTSIYLRGQAQLPVGGRLPGLWAASLLILGGLPRCLQAVDPRSLGRSAYLLWGSLPPKALGALLPERQRLYPPSVRGSYPLSLGQSAYLKRSTFLKIFEAYIICFNFNNISRYKVKNCKIYCLLLLVRKEIYLSVLLFRRFFSFILEKRNLFYYY